MKSREKNVVKKMLAETNGGGQKTGEKKKEQTTPGRDGETEWLTEKQNDGHTEPASDTETGMEAKNQRLPEAQGEREGDVGSSKKEDKQKS